MRTIVRVHSDHISWPDISLPVLLEVVRKTTPYTAHVGWKKFIIVKVKML